MLKPLHSLVKHPQGLAGVIIVGMLLLLAVLAPALAWHSPNEQFSHSRLLTPSRHFIFGTDEFSRDIWARVLYGLRTSLIVGFVSVLIGGAAGSLLGFLGGFSRGIVDAVLSRLTDAMLAFPAIVTAIAIAAALGRGTVSMTTAITIFNVPVFARLARAAALTERERDYVTAERAVGAMNIRILFLHVVPNTLAPLLVQGAFSVSFAVLLEAGLSFLGLGTAPPGASIGGMLDASRTFMRDDGWYPVFPGAAIVLLLVGMNFLADAINEISDPRFRAAVKKGSR